MVTYPRIPGHEIGATIERIGKNVPAGFSVGQTVTVNPYTNCGHCDACHNNRVNACENNETLGVQRDGAMREYIALPWQKIIPADRISPRDAALVEPLSVGFHAVDRGQVSDIDVVLVLGCGMVGTETGAPNLEYKFCPECRSDASFSLFIKELVHFFNNLYRSKRICDYRSTNLNG